jgi:hypothetical protein
MKIILSPRASSPSLFFLFYETFTEDDGAFMEALPFLSLQNPNSKLTSNKKYGIIKTKMSDEIICFGVK